MSKVPIRVRYGAPALTVPVTEMRLSDPSAALNLVSLDPSDTLRDLSAACMHRRSILINPAFLWPSFSGKLMPMSRLKLDTKDTGIAQQWQVSFSLKAPCSPRRFY